jgi:integrase/recombinase XerD
VYSADGVIRNSVTLGADQTKGHRARVFYVNQRLSRVFAEYWRVVQGRDPHSPLFQTQQATAFSANTISQLFLHIYAAAGLDGCSSHSGRRSFITRLAEQGVAVHLLAALAGHRSIQTTQRYITVNDALLARAVELA